MNTVLQDMTQCTGCRACEQICAQHAISMVQDHEEFFYPQINQMLCSNCGQCAKHCPTNLRIQLNPPQKVFAAIHKDHTVLADSSSGGAFTALANMVLQKGGCVVGCALNGDFYARHRIADTLEQIVPMRGSKYVQSDTADTYRQTESLLRGGTPVLYTGTPCQIAGLKAYLNRDYAALITVDMICHGVPSPGLFAQHMRYLRKRERCNIIDYRFRSKLDRLMPFCFCYRRSGARKQKHGSAVLDPYYMMFLSAKTYRECCYQCPYAREERTADFTIADYWHVERFHPELSKENGVSILTANTIKACGFLKEIGGVMALTESSLAHVKSINANINHPASRPTERDSIYQDIALNGYGAWAERYCSSVTWKLHYLYGKLPYAVRKQLKRLRKKGSRNEGRLRYRKEDIT